MVLMTVKEEIEKHMFVYLYALDAGSSTWSMMKCTYD